MKLMRLLRGCVYVRFSGDNPERMLTLLSRSRFNFWGIKRFGAAIQVCMYAPDFKKLRKLRGNSGIKVHIAGRRGLPFILRRYRHRSGLAVGFALFLLLNAVASMFIWNIRVEGNNKLTEGEIRGYLADIGIREGSLSRNVDCETARLKLAIMSDTISWASLTIEGSQLIVAVSEREPIDKTDTTPCNLVASRNGVIDEIHALTGVTAVKVGDTVTKGQLLVSGVVEYSTGSSKFLAAKGDVFAITTRDITVTQPYKVTRTQRTGRVKKRSVLSFFTLNVPLYVGDIKFPYEKTVQTHFISTDSAYLPIRLTTASFFETEEVQITLTEENAKAEALKQMEEICFESDFEILEYEDFYTQNHEGITLRRHITARENIAEKEILKIEGANND